MKLVEAEASWLLSNKSVNKNLFDDKIVNAEIDNILNLLNSRQNKDGGLSWYGGASDVYITQLWAKGMGEFIDKGMVKAEGRVLKMLQGAIAYLDNAFVGNISANSTRDNSLHYNYLYTRALYEKLIPISKKVQEKRDLLLAQSWNKLSIQEQIKLGIVAHNVDNKELKDKLVKQVKSTLSNLENLKINSDYPYYYNNAEIISQAIELLFKVDKTDALIHELKAYLLKNKQGKSWGSTKSTTQVLYALFFYNEDTNNKNASNKIQVQIGNEKVAKDELVKLSKIGAFQKSWTNIDKNFTTLRIVNNDNLQPINGNLNWKYFEDFSKVSNEENASIKKTLLIRKNGDNFEPLSENNTIKVGDLVRVCLEIEVKSPLAYVHIKDMRGAGFEPIDVFSEMKKISNLSYYQAVSDASMNFFTDNLPMGKYVLEYDLRATYKDNYNNGVTSIESMYAPEKSAYSKAMRLTIE